MSAQEAGRGPSYELREGCRVRCLRCGFSAAAPLLRCPRCGGPLLIECDGVEWRVEGDVASMWRYSRMMGFKVRRLVSAGEGLTPVTRIAGVLAKLETRNPTKTYADRAASGVFSSFDLGPEPVDVGYVEDYATSMAYYARMAGLRLRVIVDPALADPQELMELVRLGADVEFSGSPNIAYDNPVSLESLKTIAFEIAERGYRVRRVLVPAVTGFLAISIHRGFEAVSRILSRVPDVVAVLAGDRCSWAREALRGSGVEVCCVDTQDVLRTLVRLAERGIYLKPLAAAALSVAQEGGDLVIITGAARRQFREAHRRSGLRELVLKVLSEGQALTAYEIWRRLGSFTLRGVYSALESLERSGLACHEYELRGSRKVKLYRACQDRKA